MDISTELLSKMLECYMEGHDCLVKSDSIEDVISYLKKDKKISVYVGDIITLKEV